MIPKSKVATFVKDLTSRNRAYSFNCWGFTAILQGWSKSARWLDEDEIEDMLEEKTAPIDDENLQFGDVLVYRDYNYGIITHTAVYIGGGIAIHKPGKFPVEKIAVDKITRKYECYGNLDYCARPLDACYQLALPF